MRYSARVLDCVTLNTTQHNTRRIQTEFVISQARPSALSANNALNRGCQPSVWRKARAPTDAIHQSKHRPEVLDRSMQQKNRRKNLLTALFDIIQKCWRTPLEAASRTEQPNVSARNRQTFRMKFAWIELVKWLPDTNTLILPRTRFALATQSA